MIDYERL
jgi:hypothetical protein